jgi:hypothetical protein
MLRRFLQTVAFHPAIALALILLGPMDGCPLR